MSEVEVQVSLPMPYFAELPYYLWGQINYDSEGDCRRPTDRTWSWLHMANRITGEQVMIKRHETECTVSSESSTDTCTKLKAFLIQRTLGVRPAEMPEKWNHASAFRRTEIVAQEFEHVELKPFDSHTFWGSWKWVGWFATDCTWVGRWIMHSVVRKDPRAVNLCIEWLRTGTVCATWPQTKSPSNGGAFFAHVCSVQNCPKSTRTAAARLRRAAITRFSISTFSGTSFSVW